MAFAAILIDWRMGFDRTITTSAAVRQLFAPIAAARRELVAIAFLGPEWTLLGVRYCDTGQLDAIDLPFRDIARDAIRLDAAHVVMAHNHPSGDCSPSRADIAVTQRLALALGAIGVGLAEHIVLAADGATSLRDQGLL